MRAGVLFWILIVAATSGWSQETTLYSIGQPTDEEQLYLEMINRARANPTEEGLRLAASTDADVLFALGFYGVDVELMKQEFEELPVRPPLAMNAKLTQMARAHTQDMFENAFQGHFGSNPDPNLTTLAHRVSVVGYNFSTLGENVFSFANTVYHGHAGFQVDWGTAPGEEPDEDGMQEGRGHRVNIHGEYREVGLGVTLGMNTVGQTTVGPQLVTQNFGSQVGSSAYVTGVAFYDLNGNGFYDLGEGIGGLTVNVEGSLFHAVTTASGGYAVPVATQDATREVTFAGLGLNQESEVVITGGKNVKADFKPVYAAPKPTGPSVATTGSPTTYSFAAVGGATGYDWQALKVVPLANDPAEDLERVTPQTTGAYSALSTTVKHAGASAYRLTHPAAAISAERLTYKQSFLVEEGASVSFRSRLRIASEHQVAKVQVSTDLGTSWEDVYVQPGATPAGASSLPGEASFLLREIALGEYAGQQIRLRFNYEFLGGSLFPGTGDNLGWYVDEVTFDGLIDTANVEVTAVAEGETTFDFTPDEEGAYLLSVRPKISGRDWAYSPPLALVATDIPPPAVDITVKLGAGPALVSGVSEVDFGKVQAGDTVVRTLTVFNTGTEDLTELEVEIEGTDEDLFEMTELGVEMLPPGGQASFQVTFAPMSTGVRTAMLSITSNDPDENPFLLELNGEGTTELQLTEHPQSQVVKLGQGVTLGVAAVPTVQSYQWRKNNAVIKTNATGAEYTIPQVKLTDAGQYSVTVTGGIPVTSQTSEAASLAVVEDVEKTLVLEAGKTVKLTVKAAGAVLGYEWKRNGLPLEDSGRILGRKTPILQITGLLAGDSSTYTCEVRTGDSEPTAGATTHLGVFDQKPVLLAEQDLEDGIVGGFYSQMVKTEEGEGMMATSFSAKNLPAGLKMNAKTGEISGRPTKPTEGTVVTIVAKNRFGPSETTATMVVHEYPSNLAGTYVGWMERDEMMNQEMGGRLDLKITALGTFSGSLTTGTKKTAVKGGLTLKADGSEMPYGRVEIVPKGKNPGPAMELLFYVDAPNHVLHEDSKISQDGEELALRGWRQKWSAKGPQATAYLGLHTFGLRLTDEGGLKGAGAVPQGWGYGSLNPARDGKIKLAGRTADGEAFTSASFIGPEGEVLVYQPLYKTPVKGSLLGTLQIQMGNEAAPADTTDNTMTGDLTWTRPATAGTKARVYTAGFGLAGTPVETVVELEAVGGSFFPPAADKVILNLPPGENNAELKLEEGGLETAIVALNIAAKSKITPANPESAPSTFKLAANVKTGAITGSFMLLDTPKRKITLLGMQIREGADYLGAGYLLVPELPSQEFPKITPIWSGRMTLEENTDVPN